MAFEIIFYCALQKTRFGIVRVRAGFVPMGKTCRFAAEFSKIWANRLIFG
jgi:hypothetical protein